MRDNVGEEVDAEQLIQEACRSCLEQVRPNRTRDVGTRLMPGIATEKCDPSSVGDAGEATYLQVGRGGVADRRAGKSLLHARFCDKCFLYHLLIYISEETLYRRHILIPNLQMKKLWLRTSKI